MLESEQDFTQRLTGAVNNTFTVHALTLADNTGVFDALLRLNKPATAEEIAKQAVLKTR